MSKVLNVRISDSEFESFGLQSETIDFQQLINQLKNQIMLDALRKAQDAAAKGGISNMTLAEIDAEVEAVRANKRYEKNNH